MHFYRCLLCKYKPVREIQRSSFTCDDTKLVRERKEKTRISDTRVLFIFYGQISCIISPKYSKFSYLQRINTENTYSLNLSKLGNITYLNLANTFLISLKIKDNSCLFWMGLGVKKHAEIPTWAPVVKHLS